MARSGSVSAVENGLDAARRHPIHEALAGAARDHDVDGVERMRRTSLKLMNALILVEVEAVDLLRQSGRAVHRRS